MRDRSSPTADRGRARTPEEGGAARAFTGRGFELYLMTAAVLAPIAVPAGPANTALLDAVNVIALAAFLIVTLRHGAPVRFLFAVPMIVILARSLVASGNAISVSASFLSLTRDVYLYLWFVMLVAVMSRSADRVRVRLAWLAAACALALGTLGAAFVQGDLSLPSLLMARGPRLSGTFPNANMFADYLMLSAFIALGLIGRLRLALLAPALALLGLALLTTKSNGGLTSLAAGVAVWLPARAWYGGVALPRVAGAVALALAGLVLLGWVATQTGTGTEMVRRVRERSVLARISHSSESRQDIWRPLERKYEETPVGLGPGNSSSQPLEIGERERPDSFISKEAHNDYVAYAVERGPLALLALLAWTAQVFVMLLAARARTAAGAGHAAADPALLAALLGGLVGTCVHSMVIEKLNFRHFWLFLSLACATCAPARDLAAARPRPRPRPAGALGFSPLAAGRGGGE